MAFKTFGAPTGTATLDDIKNVGDDNILVDTQEESTNDDSQTDDENIDAVDGEGEADTDPKPVKKTKASSTDADADTDTDSTDADPVQAQRSAIADELGYDLDNLTPKQAKIVDEVLAQLDADSKGGTKDSAGDDGLTEIEREVKAGREAKTVTPAETAKTATTAPATPTKSSTAPADDDADPIKLDPSDHYTVEATLYQDAFNEKLSEVQRKRAFTELREHRALEFAKDFVRNMKSGPVLEYLRGVLLADINPKLQQFEKLNTTATEIRTRQQAHSHAIVQLSKSDPAIAEFVSAPNGRSSAYQQVLKSDPKIAARAARLSENPEYADLPPSQRATLLEIDRIRLVYDLAPKTAKSSPTVNAKDRVAKVKAAAALVKSGTSVSSAAAKAAANIIAKRSGGDGSNSGRTNKPNTPVRPFDNPDAERLRQASNRTTSIFG